MLTLDKPLPAEVKAGSVLMNRSRNTNNWILRDNDLHDYYGRVMLYTDHGTATGNRVHQSLFHLGNSTAYFETAGACRNVITHQNLCSRQPTPTPATGAATRGLPVVPPGHVLGEQFRRRQPEAQHRRRQPGSPQLVHRTGAVRDGQPVLPSAGV